MFLFSLQGNAVSCLQLEFEGWHLVATLFAGQGLPVLYPSLHPILLQQGLLAIATLGLDLGLDPRLGSGHGHAEGPEDLGSDEHGRVAR